MFIPKEIIELVREKASIVDIVKRYVPSLKKQGRNFTGLCPFHKEKTPSFSVSPEKNIFKCFGCHAGGNVFTFVSKVERLDFTESVNFVADIVGVEMKAFQGADNSKFDIMTKLNQFALNQYHNFLKTPQGKSGLDYLLKRGVTKDSINAFKLGFSPDLWDYMKNSLKQQNFNLSIAENLGLLSSKDKNEGKHYYDRFRNRVIFPIFDQNNRVLAFGGRIIGDGSPKYVNSPESEIYKKRNVLYGFNRAGNQIRELDRAIVVEGYLDVIGAHQEGIENVVAPLGTALTEEHISLLSRYCNEIVFIFDSDSSGQSASLRSIEVAESFNVNARVGILPEGDPFDFIQTKGVREFMSIVDSALKPVDYQIDRILLSKKDSKSTINTLIELFNVVKTINFETERSKYLKKISAILQIEENLVRKDFQNYINTNKISPNVRNNGETKKIAKDFMTRSYHDLLKLLCNYPELIQDASLDFSEENIPDTNLKNIFKKLIDLYNKEESFTIDKMFDFFHDDLEMDFLNECFK